MKGLILKDFLCLRKVLRSVLLVIVFYSLLAFCGFFDPSVLAGTLTVMVAMLPMTCFSYDHAAKWDPYARVLPVSRVRVVAARYCTILLVTGLALLISLALGLIGRALGRMDSLPAYLAGNATALLFGLVMNALMLPLLYKFGAERARVILYGVLGAVVSIGLVILFPLGGVKALKALDGRGPDKTAVLGLAVGLPAAGLVLLTGSFALSVRFYRKKEV